MQNWIKCSERMPELEQEVLCIDKFSNYEAAIYTKGYFGDTPFFAITAGEFHPTYWQPLPEPPQE